jgi:hypothetical protein
MTSKPVKKLHIVTHGCQMNEYDSARMGDLLGDSHQMVATCYSAQYLLNPRKSSGKSLSSARSLEAS